MKLSAEQVAVVKSCKTPEELIAKAAEAGFQLDEAQAAQLLNSQDFEELDPDNAELANASGGCNNSGYRCWFCKQDKDCKDGFYPYEYTCTDALGNYGGFIQRKVCPACYEQRKNEPGFVGGKSVEVK